jgi:hypothetical protein
MRIREASKIVMKDIYYLMAYHYFQIVGQFEQITLFLKKVVFNDWKKMVTVKNIVRS